MTFVENVGELQEQLAELRRARASGVRLVTYGAGPSSRTVEYKSDEQMAAAVNDLLSRIAAAQSGRDARIVYPATSKGFT